VDYELDVTAFWQENDKCFTPFTTNKPRVPINFWLDDHFLLEEMKLPSTTRYYEDTAYRLQTNCRFNDQLQEDLGKRFYPEQALTNEPYRFEVLLGAKHVITEGQPPWLESTVETIEDVKRLIERTSKLDMESEMFPNGFYDELANFRKQTNTPFPFTTRQSRGPCTLATSILGATNTCLFVMDEPEIMEEFFGVLAEKLIEYHKALLKVANSSTQGGFSVLDDNCYLFSPQLYERFCAPVLTKLFAEFAPRPEDLRFQHSDSPMGHLMSILSDIGVNKVNLGPTIDIADIRRAMPQAIICGHIPPFTLRNGSAEQIIDAVKRDIELVGADGGLEEWPAGSVPGGTPLKNLKTYMWAVHTYGRY